MQFVQVVFAGTAEVSIPVVNMELMILSMLKVPMFACKSFNVFVIQKASELIDMISEVSTDSTTSATHSFRHIISRTIG